MQTERTYLLLEEALSILKTLNDLQTGSSRTEGPLLAAAIACIEDAVQNETFAQPSKHTSRRFVIDMTITLLKDVLKACVLWLIDSGQRGEV